jgi:site-specific recombinase XerD
MNEAQTSLIPFPERRAAVWIDAYQEEMLQARDEATIEAYTRILEKFTEWLSFRPGNSGQFRSQAITRTAIEGFLDTLPSFSYKKQARAALSGFCRWLQEDQRYVIRDLVEQEADGRGKAAFALGYFAGCRVSDVSWLLLDHTHVSRKAGWMTVGHKGGKERTIDLVNWGISRKVGRRPFKPPFGTRR